MLLAFLQNVTKMLVLLYVMQLGPLLETVQMQVFRWMSLP